MAVDAASVPSLALTWWPACVVAVEQEQEEQETPDPGAVSVEDESTAFPQDEDTTEDKNLGG